MDIRKSSVLLLAVIILATSSCAIPANPAENNNFSTKESLEKTTVEPLTETSSSFINNIIESTNIEAPNIATSDIIISTDVILGTEYECIHSRAFNNSYHTFTQELINYVGKDAFYEWVDKTHKMTQQEAPESCRSKYTNISQFIKDFNIPKDEFIKLCDNTAAYYTSDYNIDILYSGDDKLIDEYYSNTPDDILQEHRKRSSEFSLKIQLAGIIGNDKYVEWAKEKNYNFIDWSIPQFVKEFNITREDFQSALDKLKDEETYDYDVDKLYSDDAEISAALRDGVPAVEIDAMLHK